MDKVIYLITRSKLNLLHFGLWKRETHDGLYRNNYMFV